MNMNTKHIVSVKNNTITSGTLTTPDMEGDISISADDSNNVKVSINGQWMNPTDLLAAAKLFKKLAKVLAARE